VVKVEAPDGAEVAAAADNPKLTVDGTAALKDD